ncbi:molybdate ABC transporter substrate-binding protein [Leucothrix arctica]|uniref:Molybdate ABC transporter substrate-binding protein n=1 Tax=Leucothrix arctica TaxID=1481894 RepID=A0A317CIS9_9GAMM|nr:molybdate ABC transporter substrate-binding protein [Leucothrix arctica]PWQ96230.1 molybdate ABC transporter substrate-binding protein [Leucothrix arctica]
MINRLKKCVSYCQSYAKAKLAHNALLALLCLSAPPLFADEVLVAVASNFIKPMKVIAERFEAETGHQAKLAFGSSGKLLAQITHGAPFDVFLSADKDKVTRIIDKGLAVKGSEFIYAKGRLVLWSAKSDAVESTESTEALRGVLEQGDFDYFAMANPKLAPYGAAAKSVLARLELTDSLKDKVVMGENIAQTFQFVQTGNAALGFVALSQIKDLDESEQGSHWLIPTDCYPAIEQYAVILKTASDNPAASALTEFLNSDSEKKLIRSFGYD